jgi:hypothetical protein
LTVYEDDPNINASRCVFHRQESGDTLSVAHILLESDCLVCRFLSAIINSFDIDQTAAVVAAFEPWKWQDKPDGKWYFRLHIHDITNLELSPTLGLELFLNKDGDLGSGDWAHEAGTLPEISGDTGSSRALTWLRQRLDDCESSSKHHDCVHKELSKTSELPLRVIEITNPGTVRLYVSGRGERARYVCLSHCWGGKQPITTTKATLNQHQTAIAWDALPKMFRDVISIVHSLGLRYLWIDSLCIIQDDIEDWRQEGSKMAKIYQSAHLTISAISVPDSSTGLFSTASPHDHFRKITFQNSDRSMLV